MTKGLRVSIVQPHQQFLIDSGFFSITFANVLFLMLYRVVEFRTEELMKKAVEKVNKHVMNGRPLKVKEVSKNE